MHLEEVAWRGPFASPKGVTCCFDFRRLKDLILNYSCHQLCSVHFHKGSCYGYNSIRYTGQNKGGLEKVSPSNSGNFEYPCSTCSLLIHSLDGKMWRCGVAAIETIIATESALAPEASL